MWTLHYTEEGTLKAKEFSDSFDKELPSLAKWIAENTAFGKRVR